MTAFVRHFDWIVVDPQIDGIPPDHYDGASFVAAWQRSCTQTLPAFLKDDSSRSDVLTLPTDELNRIWQWNRARSELQSNVGDDKFVPRISLLVRDSHPASAIVWTDGIPMVFPKVDFFILHRHELAPRRLFKRRPDFSLLPWETALSLVGAHVSAYDGETATLQYSRAASDVVSAIKTLPPSILKPALISLDSVLDSEWVENALAKL